jgi:hypothetical protein
MRPKVWRHAWGEYSKDFKKDILDQHKTVKGGGEEGQGESNQRAQRGGEVEVPDERGLGERADEKVREFRQGVEGMRKAVGVDAKMDTKEDVLEALGQVGPTYLPQILERRVCGEQGGCTGSAR